MRILAVLTVFAGLSVTTAHACGPDTNCIIGDRSYRILLPEGHDGSKPIGAIVHAHGYKGTAAGVMRSKGLAHMASALGVALIAPQTAGNDWVIPGVPRNTGNDGSEEFAYFDALIADVTERFAIDPQRIVASGFSAGGMMVWNLACHRGELFAGFVPVAGTFWAPVPETCPSDPVHLIHIHGTADTVVPLDGRPIADTRQGAVEKAVALFAREGEFGDADPIPAVGLDCTRRGNPDGRILDLCLHPGGHSLKSDWLAQAWRTLEDAGAL